MITIEKITPKHIDGFRHAIDVVAREHKYLAFLEAPSLKSTRAFVVNNIRQSAICRNRRRQHHRLV